MDSGVLVILACGICIGAAIGLMIYGFAGQANAQINGVLKNSEGGKVDNVQINKNTR